MAAPPRPRRDGCYFPEMVMDATMQPGLNHFVMKGMESVLLPCIPASILQNVALKKEPNAASKFQPQWGFACRSMAGDDCRRNRPVRWSACKNAKR